MKTKLFLRAAAKLLSGFIVIALLLFIPAGSLKYSEAWLFLSILFVPMIIAGIALIVKKPSLLEKRLDAKEKQSEQKLVLILSAFMFLSAFIVAGLNFRFKWIELPGWVPVVSAVLFLASYILYAEVLKENEYLSRTVEVQENQKVVDTGLYGIVRHPMYMSTVLLFLLMPLVLGSVISLAVMLFYIPIIVLRIRNEEKVLEEGLDGYSEYKKKVKYRLIPFIW